MTPADPWRLSFRCDASPDEMEAHPDGLFCHRCQEVVLDLSALTEAEALLLRRGARGAQCVLLRQDQEGRALFREPGAPPWHGGRLLEWLHWRSLAAASAAALSMAACEAPEFCEEAATAADEPAQVERGGAAVHDVTRAAHAAGAARDLAQEAEWLDGLEVFPPLPPTIFNTAPRMGFGQVEEPAEPDPPFHDKIDVSKLPNDLYLGGYDTGDVPPGSGGGAGGRKPARGGE